MSAQHVHFFFQMREQIKLYHWQTYSYARHKATDDVVKSLDEHIDLFVEVWMGKYGRPKMTKATDTITVKNMADKTAHTFIKTCLSYLEGPLTKSLKPSDTDLSNIRDEMMGDLHQLLYLFTLR